MIFEGSRYENEPVRRVKDADGVGVPTLYPRRHSRQRMFGYDVYTTKLGDRLDTLAGYVYGDGELWWRLADYNPEIFYPDEIPEGTKLRIPRA